MKVLLFAVLVCLVAACSVAPPAVAPSPQHVTLVPVSVTNNRPEAVTVSLGSRRLDMFHGMSHQVVMVDRAALPSDGCTNVTARLTSREEWVSPRFCLVTGRSVTVLISSQLSSSTASP